MDKSIIIGGQLQNLEVDVNCSQGRPQRFVQRYSTFSVACDENDSYWLCVNRRGDAGYLWQVRDAISLACLAGRDRTTWDSVAASSA